MMAKSLVAANEATAMAQQERDQFFLDLERMTATAQELEQELKETTQDLTQRLFNAKQEKSDLEKQHQQVRQALESECQAKLEQANDDMSLLRHRSEKAIQEMQQDAVNRIQAWQQEHDATLQAKNEEMEQTKIHYEELATAVRAQAAQNITSLEKKADLQKRSLQEQHAKHVALLEEEMKLKQKASDALLQETREEAKNTLKQQKDAHEKELASMEAEYTAKLNEANNNIQALKKELKALQKNNYDLQTKYNAASEEVSRWEQLYGSRSYCNFTYIQEDTVAAAVATQKTLVKHATRAAKRATKATRNFVNMSKQKAEPLVKTTKQLLEKHILTKTQAYYEEHLKEHVDKYVVPYAVPAMSKTGVVLNKAWKETFSLTRRAHNRLVQSYKNSCPNTLKRIQQMEHAPESMVRHVQESCRDPVTTVNTFLWTVLFVVVVMFRSFLWNKTLALVLLPFRIIWFFSPLRLLLGQTPKHQESSTNDEMGDDDTPIPSLVKSKKVNKVPPQ
jgi:hypothetical protein